jgi:hypothetical protein
MTDFKKGKYALYLRRSKGEGGTTDEQLKTLLTFVEKLEKSGKIRKVNRGVKGRDLAKKRRGIDLTIKGDIFNEGEGQSGYNVAERPVFMDLLERLRDGEYQGVLAVSMDRFARNYGALSRYAYDLWGEQDQPRMFYGFAERMGLGEGGERGLINEKVLSSLMEWGGLAKALEIKKGETKRKGTNVDRGYLLGSRPEWLGKTYRGKTSKGVNYRQAFEKIKANAGTNAISRSAGKFDKTGAPDRGFVRNWKKRLIAYDRLGVLEDWLDAYEAVNEFIRDIFPTKPKSGYESQEASNLLKATAGYFAYPAGVVLVNEDTGASEFVTFPYPLDVGLDTLGQTKDASMLENFVVEREELGDRQLDLFQTQPRSGGK